MNTFAREMDFLDRAVAYDDVVAPAFRHLWRGESPSG